MKKLFLSASMALMLGAVGTASAIDKPEIIIPSYTQTVKISNLSDNGKYGISSTMGEEDVDNPKPKGGMLFDIDNRKLIKVEAPASGWASLQDVTDDGTVVGSYNGKPASWSLATGEWKTYRLPGGFNGGDFTAVTPDGKFAVGYFYGDNEFEAEPMAYNLVTGKEIELTNLPVVDLSGINQNQNVFFGISPDGRYALGQMSQSYLMPVALFSYVYDLENQTWKAIGYEYNATNKTYYCTVPGLHFVDNQFLSTDGNWVTGSAYMVPGASEVEGGAEYYAPYRYNIATGKMEVYEEVASRNIGGDKITNDGVILGHAPHGEPYPTAQIRCGKFFIPLDMVLEQVYGINVNTALNGNRTGSFAAISADGLTASMVTYDNCYIIRMPEPFAEAAAKVDMLASYTCDIPSGTAMSQLRTLNVTFDRAISTINNPSSVELLNQDGDVVRGATSADVSVVNNHTLTITFRTQTLEAGKKYTVRIPAGYVQLADDKNIASKEINLEYYGRKEGAVSVTGISPADGAVVPYFDSASEFVTLTFDATVKIADSASAILYRVEGDNLESVSPLMGYASGKQAIFFPASTVQLYKGSEYRLVIAAGSVTDLSGAGGCEEITLNYKGSYVRQLSNDDIYLYNNPIENYDNLIFWHSEMQQPAVIPASWGFEAENPWLLLRSSDESDDWTLASHSMFTPAGTSDKWAIVPQLYIPDANCFLAFDAQSYLKAKQDRLKVIVYTYDPVINYFTMELENEFLEKGEVVFDEILTPGKTEEGLDGEWQHVAIPLGKWEGKNIYIAFINNNEDQSAIFLDNIQVARNLNFLLTNMTPSSVVDASSVEVKGIVSVSSEIDTFKGIELILKNANGDVISTIEDADVELKYQDTYNFKFDESLPLLVGIENGYSIDVISGRQASSFTFTVKDLVFEPVKRVVLEEYTGTTCPNCPMGINALENLERTYPGQILPIAVRAYGADAYGAGMGPYADFLGLPGMGAPSGIINRRKSCYPMISYNDQYFFTLKGTQYESQSDAYVWADAVRDEMEIPADASIDFNVNYNETTGELYVPCLVKFALNKSNTPVGLFAVVVEDNLEVFQQNNLYQKTDPNLGEWGAGGIYGSSMVKYPAQDVCRKVLSKSFNGDMMAVNDFVAGETYTHSFTTNAKSAIKDKDNSYVVVMLIDLSTGNVINAAQAKFGEATSAGVESAAEEAAPLAFASNGNLYVVGNGELNVRVYGMNGMLLAARNGVDNMSIDLGAYRGVAIVNVNGVAKKVLVK